MFCVGCHVFFSRVRIVRGPWFSVTFDYINGVMFCLQYRLQISCRFLSTANFFQIGKAVRVFLLGKFNIPLWREERDGN